ncbi:DNA polymerase IV [Rhizocola hellebori]|uniref:DNA polymerase IV n=1 Tax=Rhizocola hellebori TaxID=1392758 RepID=A0A8J3VGP7_9ACTN|nr:DNA polymerase IV [Rhizocola hellebori]GIH05113.1 DNA polymerase IV [Rhizocola hellebori]
MTRWVLHVDMDQFIAAVEVLRRPELRGRPVVVGGDGDPAKRGVVSTASYEAREFGVHSGMPLRLALRKCPEAVFLAVDAQAYEAVSAKVMESLRATGCVVEVLGWDEAFVGYDGDDPRTLALDIQRRVLEATSLHCSVGIGDNKLQAKLATDFGKPAGIFELSGRTWFEVLGDRSTEALWGIGGKTAKKLAALNIFSVRQLAETDPAELAKHVGPAIGPWLVSLGRGESSSQVSAERWIPRSCSRETTFQQDIEEWEKVRSEVVVLAQRVGADAAAQQRPVARVVVKVRFVPFTTRTRGQALPEPTNDIAALELAALAALEKFTTRRAVRLLGVRAEFDSSSE